MGASPGSMAQVIALSTELGGDLRAIAIVQTVRVLLLGSSYPCMLLNSISVRNKSSIIFYHQSII
jgi:uncharacterized membrane protein AbrB (regulator of aidB expression)